MPTSFVMGVAPRVQGGASHTLACGGSGACTTTITLNSFAVGDTLAWGANTNNTSVITESDNCSGSSTSFDGSNANGQYIVQGTGASLHGNCTISITATNTFSITGWAEEVLDGYSLDTGATTGGHSITNPFTAQHTITTTSMTPTKKDYCIVWTVDQNGSGVLAPTVGGSYSVHDTDMLYPLANADQTLASTSATTATWTYSGASTEKPAAGIICYTPPASVSTYMNTTGVGQ